MLDGIIAKFILLHMEILEVLLTAVALQQRDYSKIALYLCLKLWKLRLGRRLHWALVILPVWLAFFLLTAP